MKMQDDKDFKIESLRKSLGDLIDINNEQRSELEELRAYKQRVQKALVDANNKVYEPEHLVDSDLEDAIMGDETVATAIYPDAPGGKYYLYRSYDIHRNETHFTLHRDRKCDGDRMFKFVTEFEI